MTELGNRPIHSSSSRVITLTFSGRICPAGGWLLQKAQWACSRNATGYTRPSRVGDGEAWVPLGASLGTAG